MAKDRSSGCLAVAIILLVLGALVVVPGFFWVYKRNVMASERGSAINEHRAMERAHSIYGSNEGNVVLERGELGTFSLPKPGEEISREDFVAFMTAPDTTELTKQTFRRIAGEATVTWLLLTENITERNGALQGTFSLPWEFRDGNSSTSSSLTLTVEFAEESRDALLELRRGDWVNVKGDLRFSGGTPLLKNATLASKPQRVEP